MVDFPPKNEIRVVIRQKSGGEGRGGRQEGGARCERCCGEVSAPWLRARGVLGEGDERPPPYRRG